MSPRPPPTFARIDAADDRHDDNVQQHHEQEPRQLACAGVSLQGNHRQQGGGAYKEGGVVRVPQQSRQVVHGYEPVGAARGRHSKPVLERGWG